MSREKIVRGKDAPRDEPVATRGGGASPPAGAVRGYPETAGSLLAETLAGRKETRGRLPRTNARHEGWPDPDPSVHRDEI